MTRVAVYDIYSAGKLIYVGISRRPKKRYENHKTRERVPRSSELRVVEWHDSLDEARCAEKKRIKALRPPLNCQHAGGVRALGEITKCRAELIVEAFAAKSAEIDAIVAQCEREAIALACKMKRAGKSIDAIHEACGLWIDRKDIERWHRGCRNPVRKR